MRAAGRLAGGVHTVDGSLPRVPAMDTAPHHPLRDGNRLQRAYYRWALPYYERMTPDMREQVEPLDALLYSGRGLGVWGIWLLAMAGACWALRAAGLDWPWALVVGGSSWLLLSLATLAAWLMPEAFLRVQLPRLLVRWMAIGLSSGLAGIAVGHWVRHGRFDLPMLAARVVEQLHLLLPVVLMASILPMVLFWAIARFSLRATERRLEHVQLGAERDAARAAAAEAQLRLLQGQIQPHFIFNTLATLQHWVDKGDERAPGLLRELTAFLRSSTELLGQSSVSLGEEVQAVRHYLAILQARIGKRLAVALDIEPALAQQPLPPGLLLTLVENAVAHGIEPKIGGGRVQVSAALTPAGWRLCVDDDGVGLAGEGGAGVGLANLRQRLQHHFAGKACFSLQPRAEGGTRACIEVEAP